MPHVLVPAGPGTCRIAHYRGQFRQVELHDYRGGFSRIHADGFLPPNLVCIGRSWRTGETQLSWSSLKGLPLDHLHIHQVEMNRMSVTGEIQDLPDLGRPGAWRLRRIRQIRQPPCRESLVIETLAGVVPMVWMRRPYSSKSSFSVKVRVIGPL